MNNRVLTAIGYLSIAAIGLTACSNEGQQTQQDPRNMAVPVTVTTVSEDVLTGFADYPANVVPLKETELRSEVNGYITNIFVADGATVSAGQKLYEIDRVRYEAALEQAKASLSIAEANYQRVERDLARYEALAQKDAIARQVLDNAKTELANAEAQRHAAKAALITAETNLQRSVIIAPFAGTIGISEVRTGALVSAGSTLLNTISSTSPVGVDFQVSENELVQILDLQKRPGLVRDSILSLVLGGSETYSLFGSIQTIDRAVNRNTGTITVRAVFDNPEGRLRAGMSGVIRIKNNAPESQLVIPYQAVTEQLGQSMVYFVSDSNRVEQRIVTLGLKSNEKVAVLSGLELHDTIVIEGIINLRHGATVTITNQQ